jgi:hypothetical protein
MPEPSVSSIAIYQLRIVLCGVSPLVWRRLLVVSTTSIAELHEILQNAFSWSGEHLHRFLIHGAAYGIPCLGGTAKLLQDVLRIEEPINTFTIRQHVADVAERLEQELGDEQFCIVEGCQQTSEFLKSIDTAHVVGLRDRALIGVMVYAFARVSAVVSLKVEDYFPLQKRWWHAPAARSLRVLLRVLLRAGHRFDRCIYR